MYAAELSITILQVETPTLFTEIQLTTSSHRCHYGLMVLHMVNCYYVL